MLGGDSDDFVDSTLDCTVLPASLYALALEGWRFLHAGVLLGSSGDSQLQYEAQSFGHAEVRSS